MTTYTHTDARIGDYRAESSPDGCLARVIHKPTGRVVVWYEGTTAHTNARTEAVQHAYDLHTAEQSEENDQPTRTDQLPGPVPRAPTGERPEVVYRDAVRMLRP